VAGLGLVVRLIPVGMAVRFPGEELAGPLLSFAVVARIGPDGPPLAGGAVVLGDDDVEVLADGHVGLLWSGGRRARSLAVAGDDAQCRGLDGWRRWAARRAALTRRAARSRSSPALTDPITGRSPGSGRPRRPLAPGLVVA